MPRSDRTIRVLLAIIALIMIVWGLRVAMFVALPLVMALFLTVLVWPLHRRLLRHMPKWAAVIIIMLTVIAVVSAFVYVGWLATRQVAAKGPQYASSIQVQIDAAIAWARGKGVPVSETIITPGGISRSVMSWLTTGFHSLGEAIAAILLVFFLLVLLLLEADHWRTKVRQTFTSATNKELFDTLDTIVDKLHQYLVVRTAISAVAGVATGLWCLALRVDFALLWGFLTFALNFLPNVGSLISYVPPVLIALLHYGWGWGALVFVCIAGTDTIIGNVIDPIVQGKSLRLSPVLVLLSVVFWGWMWGVAGAILGVPITASMVIAFQHIEGLKPLSKLLGETDDD